MQYYSTNNKNNLVSFRDAVLKGIADDGGLYMPQEIPRLKKSFLQALNDLSFQEIAFTLADSFTGDISKSDLSTIVEKSFTFDAPLVQLSKDLSILELFHGPTLAFKDFGARFLANTMSYFNQDENKEMIILVATSGDTGSAVANGFFGVDGIKVALLYPSGKVSKIQEQQLTTIGGNIQAFEVDGTFDDCQALVKQAFMDNELTRKFNLSSANSINIARLLPQSFYYFRSFSQLEDRSQPVIFIVPCGNFGNLTAGIIASRMGLPIDRFLAAVNANAVFPQFLASGIYKPGIAIQTLSNAMDVGDPSNFFRIIDIFENNIEKIRHDISSISISDEQTIEGIQEVYLKYNYIIDPHGAVGYQTYCDLHRDEIHYILLETAHPAKFLDIVENALEVEIKVPDRLASSFDKPKEAMNIPGNFKHFKSGLLELF
jgi:threonine synthase